MGRCCWKPGQCLRGLESRVLVRRTGETLESNHLPTKERKSMTAHTKKHQTTSHTGHDEINIHVAQKQSFEHPLFFEVRVLVSQSGHHVEWTMDPAFGNAGS